jgi:hypothetical protein
MSAAPWLPISATALGPGEQKNMSCDGSVRQAPWNGQFAVKSAWILTAYYTSSYLEKAKK